MLEELLTNRVAYLGPIRQQLRPYAGELTEKLRAILRDDKAEAIRRFRAAVALADYIPESEATSWTEQDLQFVAGQLVVENAEFQPLLRENLRPISGRLLANLATIFGDLTATDAQRGLEPRGPWRRLERRRGGLPDREPWPVRPDDPLELQRLPPGPEP